MTKTYNYIVINFCSDIRDNNERIGTLQHPRKNLEVSVRNDRDTFNFTISHNNDRDRFIIISKQDAHELVNAMLQELYPDSKIKLIVTKTVTRTLIDTSTVEVDVK